MADRLFPSGFHARSQTPPGYSKVNVCCPVLASQSLTEPDSSAEAIRDPSGLQATAFTNVVCPGSRCVASSLTSHTNTTSLDAHAKRIPSGLQPTQLTGYPTSRFFTVSLFPVAISQRRIVPSKLPEASNELLGCHAKQDSRRNSAGQLMQGFAASCRHDPNGSIIVGECQVSAVWTPGQELWESLTYIGKFGLDRTSHRVGCHVPNLNFTRSNQARRCFLRRDCMQPIKRPCDGTLVVVARRQVLLHAQ